jgi:hypothetical protein
MPNRLAETVAATIALLAALALAVGGGFFWGRDVARTQHIEAQRQHLLQQALGIQQALAKGQAAGQAVAAQLQQQLTAQRTYTQQLEERARHAPLVIRTACAAPAAPRGEAGAHQGAGSVQAVSLVSAPVHGHADAQPAQGAQPAAAGPAPAQPAGALPTAPQAPGDAALPGAGSGVRFTFAALSLWNSAHAGADVPSGACRAADPTSPACAADSGVDEHAVWANQRANAARWAQCRAQLNALIDAVCGLPGQAPCPAAAEPRLPATP